MKLDIYISSLLANHNCVIVPDFGGFIANYKSAVIDVSNSKILPPSKSILFNSNLLNNDGLLGNTIANKEAVTYDVALEKIAENVSVWKAELTAGKRVEIDEIGFLYKQNNQIIFEQSREVNLLLSAYGLTDVRFVSHANEEKITAEVKTTPIVPLNLKDEAEKVADTLMIADFEVNSAEIKPVALEPEGEKVFPINSRSNKWRYLAVAAVIPLLFYSYWIPMETDFIDTGKIQMADFNPIHASAKRVYETRSSSFKEIQQQEVETWEDLTSNLSDNVTVYNYHFDDELYIPVRLDKTATAIPSEQDVKQNAVNQNNPYHIIAGCFSVQSNAENLVNTLIAEGYQASVIDKNNGLYRVAMGNYGSKDAAKLSLINFKDKGFSGWILKK